MAVRLASNTSSRSRSGRAALSAPAINVLQRTAAGAPEAALPGALACVLACVLAFVVASAFGCAFGCAFVGGSVCGQADSRDAPNDAPSDAPSERLHDSLKRLRNELPPPTRRLPKMPRESKLPSRSVAHSVASAELASVLTSATATVHASERSVAAVCPSSLSSVEVSSALASMPLSMSLSMALSFWWISSDSVSSAAIAPLTLSDAAVLRLSHSVAISAKSERIASRSPRRFW
mmetsp:Transcript_11251/g.24258  ORF Transcript_11251/g.24258 Transcript_11251/m.24258 type:complete len:235 (-) Transcript_11251:40-744(-)